MTDSSLRSVRGRFGRISPGLLTAAFAVLAIRPASAHGTVPDGWHDLWTAWSADPLVSIPLGLSAILFAGGTTRLLLRRGRLPQGFGLREILFFSAGILVLAAALLSPLESLAEALLSAHMVQHVLLVTIAPLLLVLGKPEVAWLWTLAGERRNSLARNRPTRSALALFSRLARPIPAALIHMTVLWVWHAPGLFDAAVAVDTLHWLEHVCFFGTALLFWRGVVKAAAGREGAALATVACFVTLLQSGVLSALISFAREPLYRTPDTIAWGLTALEDQQLAGAIMSVPMCVVYLVAGLASAACLLKSPAPEQLRPSRVSS